jgi:hypothetical protein
MKNKRSSNCKREYSEIGHSHILIYFNVIVIVIVTVIVISEKKTKRGNKWN